METLTCRFCGSTETLTVPEPEGSQHHARTICAAPDCGKTLRWEPKPMTPERAAAFVLPFGKHGGETLAQVAATAEGRRYLGWMLSQDIKTTLRRAITAHFAALGILDHREAS